MAYPVPIAPCDACQKRRQLVHLSFVVLRGHDLGHYCQACVDLYGEEDAE